MRRLSFRIGDRIELVSSELEQGHWLGAPCELGLGETSGSRIRLWPRLRLN